MTRRLSRFFAASSLLGLIALAGASVTDDSHSLADDPALVSEPVVQVWGALPAGGRDLVRRSRGSTVLNVAELASAVGWAGACAGLLEGSPWFVGGAAMGLVAPFVAWGMRSRDP